MHINKTRFFVYFCLLTYYKMIGICLELVIHSVLSTDNDFKKQDTSLFPNRPKISWNKIHNSSNRIQNVNEQNEKADIFSELFVFVIQCWSPTASFVVLCFGILDKKRQATHSHQMHNRNRIYKSKREKTRRDWKILSLLLCKYSSFLLLLWFFFQWPGWWCRHWIIRILYCVVRF